jgi:YbbR domain-containing protein
LEKYISYIKTNYRSISGSLFLGFLLWFTIASDKEYTHVIDVPLSIETLGENLVLTKLPPKTIKLKIKGKGRSLVGLNFVEQQIGIEFPEITSSQTLNLNDYKNQFQFPQDLGIKILDVVTPKKIAIEVDNYEERYFPLKVSYDVKTIPGYLLVDHKSEIDSVLVSGPKSLLEKMRFVETKTIKRDEERFPFDITANLISPRKGIVFLFPEKTQINFNIEQLVERTVYNIPIQIINVPQDIKAEATPTTISVRVKGGETRVSDLSIDDIDVLFDYATDYKNGKINYLMQIKTPVNVAWVEASPQFFNIKLVRKEETL